MARNTARFDAWRSVARVLVLIFLIGVGVLVAGQGADNEETKIKRALEEIAIRQELHQRYYGEYASGRIGDDRGPKLPFNLTVDTSIMIVEVSGVRSGLVGWWAMAVSKKSNLFCAVFVGTLYEVPPATEDGVPECTRSRRSRLLRPKKDLKEPGRPKGRPLVF